MRRDFEAAHKARFGFLDRTKAIVIEAVTAQAVGGAARFSERAIHAGASGAPAPERRTRFFSKCAWREADVFLRDALAGAGQRGHVLATLTRRPDRIDWQWS